MALQVTWLKVAEAELEQIWLYVSAQSPQNASAIIVRLVKAARDLGEYPRSGHVVEEFGDIDVREYPVWPVRLIYHVSEDRVKILAVVHGAQELPREIAHRRE